MHFGDNRQTSKQTDRQIDKQMDSTDALSRSRCRELRLNKINKIANKIESITNPLKTVSTKIKVFRWRQNSSKYMFNICRPRYCLQLLVAVTINDTTKGDASVGGCDGQLLIMTADVYI